MFGKELDANLVYVDATERFLDLLADVNEPEKKRKIIGGAFIKVFDEETSKLEDTKFLAQGTIYPDILESDGVKADHNVGGLCEVCIRIASNTSPFLAPPTKQYPEFVCLYLYELVLSRRKKIWGRVKIWQLTKEVKNYS